MADRSEWIEGIVASCDRLIDPRITDRDERGRQRRLVTVLLAAPFLLAAALLATTVPAAWGLAVTLAAVCALFGLSWGLAVLLAMTGRRRMIAPLALAAGFGSAAAILGQAGGLAGPMAAILLALPAEAYWTLRSRAAALAGWSALAAAAAVLLVWTFPGYAGTAAHAVHWLIAAGYVATLWPRREAFLSHTRTARPAQPAAPADDLLTLSLAEDGTVCQLGEAGAVAPGRVLDGLLGAPLIDRVLVPDRAAFLLALAEARDGGPRQSFDLRLRLPRAAGEGPPAEAVELFAAELWRAQPGPMMTLTLRPARSAAKLQEALARALERADRNEVAKSRFLAAMSHELRTPLNAIIGFSEVLESGMLGPFSDPRQKEYAGLIRESGGHLLSIVNSILDLSKIESEAYVVHREPFRIVDVTRLAVTMMSPQAAEKSLRVDWTVDPEAAEVVLDRRAVLQILLNLISNAVKFTPEGGRVSVEIRRSGDAAVIAVSDTGIGIAAENLDRIGTPFMQVESDYTRQYQGTGLGLSVVKGLTRLHNGEMAIESAPGEGTLVRITLPAAIPATPPIALPRRNKKTLETPDDALLKTA